MTNGLILNALWKTEVIAELGVSLIYKHVNETGLYIDLAELILLYILMNLH